MLLLACTGAEAPAFRATELALARPAFTAPDTDGQPYDFRAQTAGHPTLLFFGFTNCPDICPVHMATISRVLGELPAEQRSRVRVVFVTVDPERDSPTVLRSWLDHFGTDFVGLRPDTSQVNAILGELMLPAVERHEDMLGHSVRIFAFAATDGTALLFDSEAPADQLAHDLPLLIEAGAEPALR